MNCAGLVDIFHASIGIMHLMTAVGDIRVRALGVLQKPCVHLRLHIIVAVHEGDPLSRGFLHASEPGGGDTAVFLENRVDFIEFCRVFPDYFRRIVGGTIVHHDDFQIGNGLG